MNMQIADLFTISGDVEMSKAVKVPGVGRYAQISLGEGERSGVALKILPLNNAFHYFAFFGGNRGDQNQQMEVLDDKFSFQLPLMRLGKIQIIPRREPDDNFRIVVLDKNGYFQQWEIGGVTRERKYLFITCQRIYEGHLVGGGRRISAVASNPLFTYPGAIYELLWDRIARELQKFAREQKLTLLPTKTAPAWDPPPIPPVEGRGHAVMPIYYSLVAGRGRAWSVGGVNHYRRTGEIPPDSHVFYLPGTAIEDDNPMRTVIPLTWYAAEIGKKQEGHTFAPILSCKPVRAT